MHHFFFLLCIGKILDFSHPCFCRKIRASLQQSIGDMLVTRPRGAVQRCEAIARLAVHHGVRVDQQVHHGRLAPLGCHVQRRDVVLRLVVRVCAVVNQRGRHVNAAVMRSDVKRCETTLQRYLDESVAKEVSVHL